MTTTERPRARRAASTQTTEEARQSPRVRAALERARSTHGLEPEAIASAESVPAPTVVQHPPAGDDGAAVLPAEPYVAAGSFQSLRAALRAFQTTLPRIVKGQTAQVRSDKGTFSYAYADLTDVTNSIVPRLAMVGLSWSTEPHTREDGTFGLEWSLEHDESGEERTGFWLLPHPSQSSPQVIGSAMTYARRYALCAVTGVAPGGDDDDARQAHVAAQPRREEPARQEPRQEPTPSYALPEADAIALSAAIVGELQRVAEQGAYRALWARVTASPVRRRDVGDLIDAETRQVLRLGDGTLNLEQLARAVGSHAGNTGQSVQDAVWALAAPADAPASSSSDEAAGGAHE